MKTLIFVLFLSYFFSGFQAYAYNLPSTCDVVDAKKVRPVPEGGYIGKSSDLYIITMKERHPRNPIECLASGDRIAFYGNGKASHHLVCDNTIARSRRVEFPRQQPHQVSLSVSSGDLITVNMLPVNSISESGNVMDTSAKYTTGMTAGAPVQEGDTYNINNSNTNNNVAHGGRGSGGSVTGGTTNVTTINNPPGGGNPPVNPPTTGNDSGTNPNGREPQLPPTTGGDSSSGGGGRQPQITGGNDGTSLPR